MVNTRPRSWTISESRNMNVSKLIVKIAVVSREEVINFYSYNVSSLLLTEAREGEQGDDAGAGAVGARVDRRRCCCCRRRCCTRSRARDSGQQ